MDIKKELGKKIQLLRSDKGLSRQALCQDEEILTTRQLQRIEKGESIPTAQTALYLARQLGVTVDDLLDETVYFLPQGYKELKYQLCHQDHYGDPDKVSDREAVLEEIYDQYFDFLPAEEQLTVQLFQASMDVIVSRNPDFDQGLVDEHLPQALSRQRLTFNDLLVMKLAMTKQGVLMAFDMKQIERFKMKVLKAVNYIAIQELWLVQEVCLCFAELYCYFNQFEQMQDILEVVEVIMAKINDFRDKPMVLLFSWKLALSQQNLDDAQNHCQSALLLCEMLNQKVLKEKLQREWEKDLAALKK